MRWDVDPEPADPEERAVMLAAAEQALTPEVGSAWWRSGFEDLVGGFDETPAMPPDRAARPEAAFSVAPVSH